MKMSRDNSRTPMQWSDEQNGGFTTGEPWIKPGVSWKEINVKNDLASPVSIIKFFRRLTDLRKAHPCLVYGSFEPLMADDRELFIYRRSLEEAVYLIILNFSPSERTKELPGGTELLISNYDDENMETIRPFEASVYKLTP